MKKFPNRLQLDTFRVSLWFGYPQMYIETWLYKQQKLKKELYEIQAYGAGKVREMEISEEEIEKLVFGDR